MYKMMGIEGVSQAMMEYVPLQVYQYQRMNNITPKQPFVNTFDEEGCSRKGTLNGPPELDQKTQQENDQENEHHQVDGNEIHSGTKIESA